MFRHSAFSRALFVLCVPMMLAGVSWLSSPATGQVARPTTDDQPFAMEIDLQELLKSNETFSNSLRDPAFQIKPDDGTTLLKVLVHFTPGKDPVEIGNGTLSMRGGKFVAWQIVPPDRRSREREARPAKPEFSLADLESGKVELPDEPIVEEPEAEGTEFDLPDDAPRLTRRFTLMPDGSVQWRLDKGIQNAEITGNSSLYRYVLDPLALRAENPGTPPRITRNNGESSQAYQRRRTEATQKFREEQAEYRELQNSVRELPEQFGVQDPQEIWAVYEVREDLRGDMVFNGPPPLPWSISMVELTSLRELAGGRRNFGGQRGIDERVFNVENQDRIRAENNRIGKGLQTIAKRNHPLSNRLLVQVLIESNMVSAATPDDELYHLISEIIDGDDKEARRHLLAALALTTPATEGTTSLLRLHTGKLDGTLKLLMLQTQLGGDGRNREMELGQMQEAIRTINNLLRDDEGPPAGAIVALVAETTDRLNDNQRAIFGDAIAFNLMRGEALDRAIKGVIAKSGEYPVVAEWLDRRLLGSSDPDVVRRTMELLGTAYVEMEGGSGDGGHMAEALLTFVFGAPTAVSTEDEDADEGIAMTYPILIESTRHNLFRQLQSGDEELRDVAWSALNGFTMNPRRIAAIDAEIKRLEDLEEERRKAAGEDVRNRNRRRNDRPDPSQFVGGFSEFEMMQMLPGNSRSRSGRNPRSGSRFNTNDNPYNELVDIALGQTPTPVALPEFLAREGNSPEAMKELITVVVHGEDESGESPAAQSAAKSLMGCHVSFGQQFSSMEVDNQAKFGRRMYKIILGEVPAVAGLLDDPGEGRFGGNNQVAQWFADEVAAGRLPEARRWIEPFDDEIDRLRPLAASPNEKVRNGAISAMVAGVGGTQDDAVQLMAAVKENPSDLTVNAEFGKIKQRIFTEGLADAVGSYQLVLNVWGSADAGQAPAGGGEFGPGGPGFGPGGPIAPVNPEFELGAVGRGRGRGNNFRGRGVPNTPPDQTLDLGRAQFVVEQQTVAFSNLPLTLRVADDRLAIIIEKPEELKLLPAGELERIPFDTTREELALLPQPGGEWSGHLKLANNQIVQLVMKPQ